MSKKYIIGVVGAGSTFTPELVSLLIDRIDCFGSIDLRFMDIDLPRQEIVTSLCRKILAKSSADITITVCDDLASTLRGADFVLLQLRVGGIDMRIEDEHLGLKYHLPFTETISVCGISTFLRTYYEFEKIAAVIKAEAPDAWVLNFSNPSGQNTEALYKLGIHKVIGVCNGCISELDILSRVSGHPADKLFMNWRGLNHMTFIDGVYYEGENILLEILEKIDDSTFPVPADLIRQLGFIPNHYLQYYYTRSRLADQLQKKKCRSEVVKEVDKELIESYKTAEEIPAELSKRGGFGYSRIVAEIMASIAADLRNVHYAVIRNGNTLPEFPEDAFVEVPVIAKKEGLYPIGCGPLPKVARSVAIALKDYDQLAIEGAMKRDKRLLLNSLLVHPLISDQDVAVPLLEDVLAINRDYLPEIK